MSTLLLRLAAPLQAWGINSKFDIRKTEREPSKSGVVGLLAAALGRRRDESLDDLAALKFGIRSDKEGELLKDFHMVLKDKKTSYVTTRYYLADAIFLVGLESQDENFLKMLDEALQAPVFPLFLGTLLSSNLTVITGNTTNGFAYSFARRTVASFKMGAGAYQT